MTGRRPHQPIGRARPGPSRITVLTAVAAVAASLLAVPVDPTAAAAATARPVTTAPTAKPVPLTSSQTATHRITLLTGDRVTVTGSGRSATVTLDQAAPRPDRSHPVIQTESRHDGVYAFPEDALPAIDAGLLDEELFNVQYLIENGYTDAASGELPVIVTYPAATARAGTQALANRADQLPATSRARSLPSIDAAAVTVDKRGAAQFWQRLRGTSTTPSLAKPAAPAVTTLGAGVHKVSLDRRLRLTLHESVPLIGAPQAWQAGLTGAGVTVAVLDSGIDATHPDLAGKVVESRSFVPGSDAVDRHGHGTHVASTIVGSGDRYRGVAPDARLLVGKVCADTGGCPGSAVIAGMEWAVARGADIVSMSLGGCCSDGSDVLSRAVDNLTASSGTLFVIAAGNDGPDSQTIASPGAATSALTVAATDKADAMARFSSRGPRSDGALKPDIAAPGVAIVAARAAGTSMGTPVDDRYTTASGTSMATPHVAGAAAILAQQHPDWRAADLKAALTSTARDAGHEVFAQGAGRVDVARATSQRVYAATANLDFGRVSGGGTASRQLTYRNLTDQPVTLRLIPTLRTADGKPAPDGSLTVDATVTVAAGSTATVTVGLDVDKLTSDTYTGTVVATDETTGVRLSTPVGADRRVKLTIHTLGTDGQPVSMRTPKVTAVDVPGGYIHGVTRTGVGRYQALVHAGTYNVMVWQRGFDPETAIEITAILADPQIEVTGDTEVTLDARQARPVSITTPRPAIPYSLAINYERSHADGSNFRIGSSGNTHFANNRVWVTPTERVTVGTLRFSTQWALANPQVTLQATGAEKLTLHPVVRAHADRGLTFDPDDTGGFVPFQYNGPAELVDVGYGTPDDLAGRDLRGKLALLRFGEDRGTDGIPDTVFYVDQIENLREAGAIGVIIFSAPPPGYEHNVNYAVPKTPYPYVTGPIEVTIPDVQIPRDEGKRLAEMLRRGTVTVAVTSDPNVRYSYQLSPYEDGQIGRSLDYRFGERDLARVETSYHATAPAAAASRESAWKPGGSPATSSFFYFAVPQVQTRYFGPVDRHLARHGQADYPHPDGRGSNESYTRVFDRAARTTERWGTLPAAPGAAPALDPEVLAQPDYGPGLRECSMCREGDLLFPVSSGVTADRHVVRSGGTTAVALYKETGESIPLGWVAGVPMFPLSPEPATYRFVERKRDASDTDTTWTFRSARPDSETAKPGSLCWLGRAAGHSPCHPDPFVFLRYDLGHSLRLDNTVATPAVHGFTVTAYNGQSTTPMPLIAGMKVWTSTDDGKTWRAALVVPQGRGDGDGRTFHVIASYPHPGGTAGAVSLKVEAWDVAGNRVEQVVARAFGLTARHLGRPGITP